MDLLEDYDRVAHLGERERGANAILHVIAPCLDRNPACSHLKSFALGLYDNGYRYHPNQELSEIVDGALSNALIRHFGLPEGQVSWPGLCDLTQEIGRRGVFDLESQRHFVRSKENAPAVVR